MHYRGVASDYAIYFFIGKLLQFTWASPLLSRRWAQQGCPRREPPDDPTAPGDLYARSEHTAGWVKIPSGGQIVPDAQKLIAAP